MNLKITFFLLLLVRFCSGQPTDYVASYPFNGNANDVSGNGRHGVVHGATLTADRFGKPNAAYSFPGTAGKYIDLGRRDLFSVTNRLTIAAWIRPRPDYSDYQTVVFLGQADVHYTKFNDGIEFSVFGLAPNGTVGVSVQRGGLNIPANQWTFIACTYDEEYATIYVNCEMLPPRSCPGLDIKWPSGQVCIGSWGTGDQDRMFLGDIDDVKLYDRALSAEEVRALYSEGLSSVDQPGKFLSYSLPQQMGAANIDPQSHKISIEVPCNSDLTKLTASFTLSFGGYAYVKNTLQQSKSSVNDFRNPVIYTVHTPGFCGVTNWTVILKEPAFSIDSTRNNSTRYRIPNVFTPNLDNINDVFEVGEILLGSEFTLFNRYGAEVYHSESYQNQFNGSELSSGTYFYTLKNECFDRLIKGRVTIIK